MQNTYLYQTKDDKQIKLSISINSECINKENDRETLRFIANSSHDFYLKLASQINNKPS